MGTKDKQMKSLTQSEARLKAMTIKDIRELMNSLSYIEDFAGLNGATPAGKIWWWCVNRIQEIKEQENERV